MLKHFTPVAISGGSGTRLWPLSRNSIPKQFAPLGESTLQERTLRRLAQMGSPWVLTVSHLALLSRRSLKGLSLPQDQLILEPFGRNTAPAVALMCHVFAMRDMGQETVGIFPADGLISDEEIFYEAVSLAVDCAQKGDVVTLGIKPHTPATGFGYIEVMPEKVNEKGELQAKRVRRFCEKPNLQQAREFLENGNFFWNAGIFVFKVQTMVESFRKLMPDLWSAISALPPDLKGVEEVYRRISPISIDYGIMEHLTDQVCIPCDPGWSDVGSWDEVSKFKDFGCKDQMVEVGGGDNFTFSNDPKKIFGFLGVRDLIVVDTPDALLISKKGESQEVRKVVEVVQQRHPAKANQHTHDIRPWGGYEILSESDDYKVKRISVDPGERLSYQSHQKRSEHWIVVRGEGEVILDDQVVPVKRGTHVFIPFEVKHRICNTGTTQLEFVEVQVGTYFGEDDIQRFKDDYDRV